MKSTDIAGSIALAHPRLGAMITRGAYVQPLALTIQFQFSTTAINTDVQGTMIGTPGTTAGVFSTIFVCSSTNYTVERPNWMAGSVLRGQDEYFNSRVPAVNLDIQFNGPAGFGLSYAVNISDTPIQNLDGDWVGPWVIEPRQAPTLNGRITRTLSATEVPYVVSWTLQGHSVNVPDELFRECKALSIPDARQECLAGAADLAQAFGR